MKINNHTLRPSPGGPSVSLQNSPNQGKVMKPKYLVMHYTAGGSAASSISWLTNPLSKASAHVVIGMDGSITQLVPFNKAAWHAGASSWEGLTGLNNHSIGIELDNPGILKRVGKSWISSFGRIYPEDVVIEAIHKHHTEPAGWHIYPEAQLESCIMLGQLLVHEYKLLDIIGHEDISPGRKQDPGPAFPLASARGKIMGRKEDKPLLHVLTSNANLREGPGMQFKVLAVIKKGTKADVLREHLNWRYINLIGSNTDAENEGWIHAKLLKKNV